MSKFEDLFNKVIEKSKPFSKDDYNLDKGEKEVSIILGRFQPPHNGHKKVINSAEYPSILCIVKGKKSSKDKTKNPFPDSLQKELFHCTGINDICENIFVVPNGNIVEICSELRNNNYEIREILCGEDRFQTYQNMVDKYGDDMNWNIKVTSLTRDDSDSDSGISSTKIKDHLRDDNKEQVQQMIDGLTDQLYTELKTFIDK